MKLGPLMALAGILVGTTAQAYDANAWKDGCEITDPKTLSLMSSEAALISASDVTNLGNGYYSIAKTNYTTFLEHSFGSGDTLRTLDSSSKFYNAEKTSGRSAVLIGPNLVVSAAHDVNFDPTLYRVVFGLHSTMVGGVCQPPDLTHVPAGQVFVPISAGKQNFFSNGPDYSFFYLQTNPFPAYPYLRIRRSGHPDNNEPAVMIGHPERLSTKVSAGVDLFSSGSVNGTHSLDGSSGSMVYNLRRNLVETVDAYGDSCAKYQAMPANPSLYHLVFGCPGNAYPVNTPLVSLLANPSIDIPSYSIVVGPLDNVTHVAAVNVTPSNASSSYTLSLKPSVGASAWSAAVDPGAAGSPPLSISGTSSGTINSGSSTQLTLTAGAGTTCGTFDRTVQVSDLTNHFTDLLVHHFEVGLTEFSVSPSSDFVLQKLAPPYSVRSQIYSLSNPRPTPATVQVTVSSSWLRTSKQVSGVWTAGSSSPLTLTLGASGSSTATAQVRVAVDEAAADNLPTLIENKATVTFTNTDNVCEVPGNQPIVKNVRFLPGARVVDPNAPSVPNGGSGFGTPISESIVINDDLPIDTLSIDMGFYNYPLSFVPYDLANVKAVLVSPNNTHITLWDGTGSVTGSNYSTLFIPDFNDTFGVLHIDDEVSPPPATHLSSLRGQSSMGTWTLEISGKNGVSSVFGLWSMRFGGRSSSWTEESPLGTARNYQTATVLANGKVLIAGGTTNVSNVAFATTELYDLTSNSWSQGTPLQTGRFGHTATQLASGKVLVVGGTSATGSTLSSAELYDPTANTWTAAPSMANARQFHSATLLSSGKVLVSGGSIDPLTAELYDPTTNSWASAGSPIDARYFHAASLLPSGKVLVTGGRNRNTDSLLTAEIFDPATNQWAAVASMPNARYTHTQTVLSSGQVLVAGGYGSSGNIANAEVYNPATNAWSVVGSLSTTRSAHTSTLLPSGRVLVIGGGSGSTSAALSSAEVFDPATSSWTAAPRLNTARDFHTASVLPSGAILVTGGVSSGFVPTSSTELYQPSWTASSGLTTARVFATGSVLQNGKLLVAGGYSNVSGTVYSTAEIYDATSNSWSSGSSMKNARYGHTTTLLPSGKILLSGGYNSTSGVLATTDIYDPASNKWKLGASMSYARQFHTATLLPSGKVLVAGGSQDALPSELYDPAADTWTTVGSPIDARYFHDAVLLQSGKVLASGGRNRSSSSLTSAEIFDPATNLWTAVPSMLNARYQHTLTVLPSGRVLAAAGYGLLGNVSSSEVYDPVGNTWSAVGSLSTTRSGHRAILLPSGRVLVTGGGEGSSSAATAVSELYDPVTATWSLAPSMTNARADHVAAQLLSGTIVVAGGVGTGFTPISSTEQYLP